MATQTKKSFINDMKIPLTELSLNTQAKVAHIIAGRNASQRLSGLGITIGTPIKILSQAPFKGPLQIEIRNTRLAIGRGLAQKIIVSRL